MKQKLSIFVTASKERQQVILARPIRLGSEE
jgi:hypothetical protein